MRIRSVLKLCCTALVVAGTSKSKENNYVVTDQISILKEDGFGSPVPHSLSSTWPVFKSTVLSSEMGQVRPIWLSDRI